MKTSDYTIEDLVQGAELESNNYRLEIQGNIGKVFIAIKDGELESSLYTIEKLKSLGYELIKPIKMNGEFEVKKYENDYPIGKATLGEPY